MASLPSSSFVHNEKAKESDVDGTNNGNNGKVSCTDLPLSHCNLRELKIAELIHKRDSLLAAINSSDSSDFSPVASPRKLGSPSSSVSSEETGFDDFHKKRTITIDQGQNHILNNEKVVNSLTVHSSQGLPTKPSLLCNIVSRRKTILSAIDSSDESCSEEELDHTNLPNSTYIHSKSDTISKLYNSSNLLHTTSSSINQDSSDSTSSFCVHIPNNVSVPKHNLNSGTVQNVVQHSNNFADLQSLILFIDKKCHSMFPPWSGEIMFPPQVDGNINVTKYADKKFRKHVEENLMSKTFFCNEVYPSKDGFISQGFKKLTKDLQRAAFFSGFEIIKNGKYDSKQYDLYGCQKFVCSKCRLYNEKRSEHTKNTSFRKSTYHQDRLNTRGPLGKKMCRRTTTKRPIFASQKCNYFFLIHYNEKGFYVVPGIGNTNHRFHPKLGSSKLKLPPRLHDEVNQTFIQDMNAGNAADSIIRNVLFVKTGQYVSRANINYLKRNAEDLSENDELVNRKNISPSDVILLKAQSKNYDYMVLLQDPLHGILPISQAYSGSSGYTTEDSITDLNQQETSSLQQFILDGRMSLSLKPHHKYMISFSWVTPSEKEKCNLFPEVMTVDTVFGTNNENRPLLTMGGKDSNGKMFIFLRAYLPHEKGWIFRWIFSVVLPKMFSNTVLQRTRLVISDGDLQEYQQLDNAIEKYFPHIVRIRCGWHIVDRAWDKYFSKKRDFPTEAQIHFDRIKSNVQNWIYSWMKPGCETLEEYYFSKYLLYKYLLCQSVVQKITTLMYSNVRVFIKNRIETHESKFLFCIRKHVRHYGEYSNTVLEGCNNAIKHHSSSVTPATRLDNSFTIISNNCDMKNNQMDSDVQNQFNKSVKVINKDMMMCKTHLTQVAFEMVMASYHAINCLKCHRYDDSTWLVTRTKASYTAIKSVIPKFKRVRTVLLSNNKLSCDCPHGKLYGLPCHHVMRVASTIPGWKFPTHHDCSVVWWKAYYYYGLSSISGKYSDRNTIYKAFHLLKQKEVEGITINSSALINIPMDGKQIQDDFIQDPMNPFAYNYPSISYKEMVSKTNHDPGTEGLSQLSSINNDEHLDSLLHDDFDEDNTNNFDLEKSKMMSPYNYLTPSFKALTSIMEDNCTQDELFEMENLFNAQISRFKTKIAHKLSLKVHPKDATMVSSNLASSKKRKHHGCRGYR